jgi:hypothetical protein
LEGDKVIQINPCQARNLFLKKQLLINPKLPEGKAGALNEFACFHKCEKIELSKNIPSNIKRKITI